MSNELVLANRRLVWKIARKFARNPIELEDFFQIGCIGLIKASRKFDPSTGNAFSSYAVPLIRGEIRHYLRDHGHILKLSRNLAEKPSVWSFDRLLPGYEDDSLLDHLIAPDHSEDRETIEVVLDEIAKLPHRYRSILRLRYLEGKSSREICTTLGVSQVTVTRWCHKGLEIVRGKVAA